jgi:hypothetical protein
VRERESAPETVPEFGPGRLPASVEPIAALQRAAGNRAVAGLLARPVRATRVLARDGKPLPALSAEELTKFLHSQRGFGTSGPGPPAIDPKGVGKPTGKGYQTYAAIQVVDGQGNQVAVGIGGYGAADARHGEHMAIDQLRGSLKGREIPGGRVVVAVEQIPCPDCAAKIKAFAAEIKASGWEVYVPQRASVADPSKVVKPKTASTTVFQGNRPPTKPTLVSAGEVPKLGPAPPAPTAKAPPTASPEARAMAKEINTRLKGNLRMLRVAAVLKGALTLLSAVGALLQLAAFTQMAKNKLEGKAFILTKEIEAADAIADRAVQLQREYPGFSESVQAQGFNLFLAPVDPATLPDVVWQLLGVRSDLETLKDDLAAQVTRLKAAADEASKKGKAALAILEDPKASAALAAATFGTAELATLFAAWQDLERLEGRLRTAITALESVGAAVRVDYDFVAAWFDYLRGIWGAAAAKEEAAAAK